MQTTHDDDVRPQEGDEGDVPAGDGPPVASTADASGAAPPDYVVTPDPVTPVGRSRGHVVRRRFRLLAAAAALFVLVALVLGVLLVREAGEADEARTRLDVLNGERVSTDGRITELERQVGELQTQLNEAQGRASASAAMDEPAADDIPAAAPSGRPFQPGPMQVALTFDDGPDPQTTLAMLDTLDALGIKATFFLMGMNVEKRPDLVAEIVRRGHGVGNHSWNHPDLTKLPPEQMKAEQLQRTNDAIAAASGSAPACTRPPMGRTNEAVASAASSLGMTQTLWNVDPSDYLQQPPPELAARVVNDVKALGPDKGAVVVMHDTGPQAPNTIASITEIVSQLKAAGYSFVALC